MKRIFPVAAIFLAMTFVGLTPLAPTAHAEEPYQSAAPISFQQKDEAVQVELGMLESPTEASHGGRVPHCGDFCAVEGASGGCIDEQNRRILATCRNGRWSTLP